MVNIYDIETVEFPLGTPQLRLSVSHEEYKPGTGLKVPFTLYVERYSLSTILDAKNRGDGEPARYSLFTNKLEVPSTPSGGKVGFSINGDAGNADHRDGRRGGELELFVEDLPLKTASCIFLEASGGAGFQPSAKLEEEGRDGGKGGDGGSVKIIYSPFVSQASAVVEKFLADLYDAQKKWPSGFQEDAAALEKVLADASTGPHVPLPSFMRTKSGILKSKKVVVRDQVKKLSLALSGESHGSIFASLTQAIAVHGGNRGFGSHGSKSDGADGEPGKDGTQVVKSTAILTEIHDTDVCFAHPVQCRMLLDQVGFLYFVGSLKSRAQGVILLERLQQRLEPFLSKPAVEPKLWKAYRCNAKRLCIVENNPVSSEPYAILQLRGLYHEASAMRQQMLSGKDFFGKEPREVPRGSFRFYHENANKCIQHLEDVEKTLLAYVQKDTAVAKKLAQATRRSELCKDGIDVNEKLRHECRLDIRDTARKIETLEAPLKSARGDLLAAMSNVDKAILQSTGITFDDFVSAMGQVLFTNGNPAMAALQAVNLFYQGQTRLVKDDGVKIEKSYLISKVHDIKGDFKSLKEGYKMLKDGSVALEDAGGEKLLVVQAQWKSLLQQVRNALGKTTYQETLKKFDAYTGLLEQRNSAVLHYNSALLLLLQFEQKAAQLQLDQVNLIEEEFNSLGAGHPAMRGFLQKLYNDNVRVAQLWLYKAQAAYRFRSLNTEEKLRLEEGLPSWKCDHTFLSEVCSRLANWNRDFEEDLGQPPQTEIKARFPLPDGVLTEADENGILLVDIRVPRQYHTFYRQYDVRLSAVRFYAVGAKTNDSSLRVWLTHSGTEVIVNEKNKAIEFVHKPLTVMFEYQLPKEGSANQNAIRSDGTLSLDTDIYARVGPFTSWKISIPRDDGNEVNKGLDLSNAKKSYLEFDYRYRAMQT